MWNATADMYSNVFYGATFVDYVGNVDQKLIMVRPVNGVGYDSFICSQYFDLTIDDPAAPDDVAVDAINAIKAIPERVVYEDKALVEAARDAYSKVATTLQQALVINYADLVSAEQRIKALDPANAENKEAEQEDKEEKSFPVALVVILSIVVLLGALCALAFVFRAKLAPVVKPVAEKLKDKLSKFKKDEDEEDEEQDEE